MCPTTGMPASRIAPTRLSVGPARSSLTASAPPSLTKRTAFSSADSSEIWNEPNGMSATTSERVAPRLTARVRSEEHTSELQSRENLVCRLLLEKKKKKQ